MIADAPTRYRDAAITRLITGGALTDPAWRDALRDLPRDRFLTGFYAPTTTYDGTPGWVHSALATAPGSAGYRVVTGPAWLGAVHGPDPLVVALSGLDTWGRQEPVSISPAPAATVTMLQALSPRPGHRVLELGTGIGHTAALLTHRLGAKNVTSVEIDPDLHAHAANRLHAAGLRPTVVLGDSVEDCDADGYDRVLVGHHVDTVPPAWVTAARPGGRLLLGLRGGLGAGHHALLHHQTNTATGATELSGRLLDWTATLPGHRHPARRRAVRRPLDPLPGPVRSTGTALPVEQLAANRARAVLPAPPPARHTPRRTCRCRRRTLLLPARPRRVMGRDRTRPGPARTPRRALGRGHHPPAAGRHRLGCLPGPRRAELDRPRPDRHYARHPALARTDRNLVAARRSRARDRAVMRAMPAVAHEFAETGPKGASVVVRSVIATGRSVNRRGASSGRGGRADVESTYG
ncbi:MAG: methyltransferase domain-containing protein [Pseudonocardia sp.]